MYPLMQPTVEKLSRQLAAGKTMEEIVVSEDTQYTEKILVETVSEMLIRNIRRIRGLKINEKYLLVMFCKSILFLWEK